MAPGVLCSPRTQGSYSGFPLIPSGLRPSRGGRGRAGGSSGMLGSWSSPAWRERAGSQLPGDPRGRVPGYPASQPIPRAWFSYVPQILRREGAGTWDQQFLPIRQPPVPREDKCHDWEHDVPLQPFQDPARHHPPLLPGMIPA